LAPSPLRLTARFSFQLNTCGHSPCVTSSLTRGWVCRLQLLLALASTFILRSESRRTHDDILLSQIRDSPNLEPRSPYLYPPGTGWPSYTRSNVKVTLRLTVGQSVRLGVEPHQVFITLTVAVLFRGAPSLTRGWVCLLYMVLALAGVVFLSSLFFFFVLVRHSATNNGLARNNRYPFQGNVTEYNRKGETYVQCLRADFSYPLSCIQATRMYASLITFKLMALFDLQFSHGFLGLKFNTYICDVTVNFVSRFGNSTEEFIQSASFHLLPQHR
jgi:hypothetical protein